MTTDAQTALAQVREALADPMLFDWARDWDRARATRVLERACSPANIAAILAHVETQAAEVERLTEENRRLRADLLAGRNVVNAGLTIHTLTIERDMLRQEIERLTAALRAQPGPVSMEDVEWAGKAHLADCEASNQRLRAALVAAMEYVQAERVVQRLAVGMGARDTGAVARLDAIIARADVVLKYNERKEK